MGSDDVLDSPAWYALDGAHAHLARGGALARRYPADVSPFAGLREHSPAAWAELAEVAGPGGVVVLPAPPGPPLGGGVVVDSVPGVQLVAGPALAARVADRPPVDLVELGEDDVPAMLDLVERTRPGPFAARTRLLGRYVGLREGGRLVAMAGERLRPPGFTELSAVCTDPAVRGRGLASSLVLAVAAGVVARGEVPFLHAAATNTGAVRLYEHLGFRRRRTLDFTAVRLPGADA